MLYLFYLFSNICVQSLCLNMIDALARFVSELILRKGIFETLYMGSVYVQSKKYMRAIFAPYGIQAITVTFVKSKRIPDTVCRFCLQNYFLFHAVS
jgi:hypothetical protein